MTRIREEEEVGLFVSRITKNRNGPFSRITWVSPVPEDDDLPFLDFFVADGWLLAFSCSHLSLYNC